MWAQSPPHIPQNWKAGWLTFLPTAGKATSRPELLRPIALLCPIGKAILKLITQQAMRCTLPQLVHAPQFAFWAGRSTIDAIAKVQHHCRCVRELVHSQTKRIHLQHSGRAASMCLLDLTQAFDGVPRDQLYEAIETLIPRSDLACLLLEWHTGTSYYVRHMEHEDQLSTHLGVRQGCPAAPFLWTLFLHHFLQTFGAD